MQQESDEIRISFIIPAYNAENTIERAITSVGKSDIIEIIVVENGSSDGTTDTVQKLVSADFRIRLFHSDKGVSNARNLGLENAKGYWISFLDADDYLDDQATETMLDLSGNEEADLYLFGHYAGRTEKRLSDKILRYSSSEGMTEGVIKILENPTRYMQVWAKLFKASIIKEHGLSFNPALSLAEDSDFTLRYALHAESMVITDKLLYHYSLNPYSVMRNNADDKISAYEHAMVVSRDAVVESSSKIQYAYNKYCLMHFNIAMVRSVFVQENQQTLQQKVRAMKNIAEKPVFRKALKEIHLKDCRSFRMLPILMIKLRLWIAAAGIYMVRTAMNHRNEMMA